MYPLRVAAVDVGSNAIRFLAAEFTGPGRFRLLAAERASIRLGTDAFGGGELSPETIGRVTAALRAFRREMDSLGVAPYRAVATSAARDSRNFDVLLDRVWREAGLRLEVISGEEEAGLVWRAVREKVAMRDRPWLMMDLGGGSLEVSLARDGRVRWSESEGHGTVRLLQELRSGAPIREEVHRRLAPFATRLGDHLDRDDRPEGLIATGGNMEVLATLVAGRATGEGVRIVPLTAVSRAIARLEALSVEERIEKLGLEPDRADVILPAAAVYARIAEAVGATEIVVPAAGLKEGVLLDVADAVAARRSAGRPTRVAFLSDVHSNVLALRSALELARESGVGRVVVAGDLVGDGPHPVEVVRMLRAEGAEAVRGNVDRKVLALGTRRRRLKRRLEARGRCRKNLAWTALRLRAAEDEHAWLEELPPELRLGEGGAQVLVVHGSPRGDTDYLYPSLTPVGLATKLEPLTGERPRVLVSGHSHLPFAAEIDGVLVVNCGSVGRSADGDTRGSLALVDLADPAGPRATLLRFDYPLEALLADLEDREVPGIDVEEYRLGIKR